MLVCVVPDSDDDLIKQRKAAANDTFMAKCDRIEGAWEDGDFSGRHQWMISVKKSVEIISMTKVQINWMEKIICT
jgi:hypothetical protein